MIEKLTLEEFEKIKKEIMDFSKRIEEDLDAHKNDNDYVEKLYASALVEYLQMQNRLLSYDLSDIPFEAWEGLFLFSDEKQTIDLSKTHANIDFSLVGFQGNGIFTGCNLRNTDILNNLAFLNSNLFDSSFLDKFYSNSLTIEDLAVLSDEQLDNLKTTNFYVHFQDSQTDMEIINILGLEKVIKLYNSSIEAYNDVIKMMKTIISNAGSTLHLGPRYTTTGKGDNNYREFREKARNADLSEIKNICFSSIRTMIINGWLDPTVDDYPESFVSNNKDLFLIELDIPDEVKQRYFKRELTMDDLIKYGDKLDDLPLDYFMINRRDFTHKITKIFGLGKLQQLIQKYPDVFSHFSQDDENNFFDFFNNSYWDYSNNIESNLKKVVIDIFLSNEATDDFRVVDENGEVTFNVPDWLSSLNVHFIDRINNLDDLLQCNDSTVIYNEVQRRLIRLLGRIDYIKRFEQETGFLFHGINNSSELKMLDALCSFLTVGNGGYISDLFRDKNMSYDEFVDQFAKLIDKMRGHGVFTDYPNYDWMSGSFRDKHPEIFIDSSAPEILRKAFYKPIKPQLLFDHKEYISYLLDKDISNTIRLHTRLAVEEEEKSFWNTDGLVTVEFFDEYAKRYGNEKALNLIAKYGEALSGITVRSLNGEIEDEQTIEKAIRAAIYNSIVMEKKSMYNLSYLSSVPEMIEEYPQIFINLESLTNISLKEREKLTSAFYNSCLTFDDIKQYPELVPILKEKDLTLAFGNNVHKKEERSWGGYRYLEEKSKLFSSVDSETFLKLCAKYGNYLDCDFEQYDFPKGLSFEELSKIVDDGIAKECLLGNKEYDPATAPESLKVNYPQLFLDENAPPILKKYFYHTSSGYSMTFTVLKEHKEWLPYLKGKSIVTSLLRTSYFKNELRQYFELFGEEKGIKLGISRAETVERMISSHQVELMKQWYNKTGGKFIPDFVVMQNFRIEEADKFLASGVNWSKLMKIKSFSKTPEARDAMLKIAYSFGAFDQDQRGFKKLQDLLTGLPKKIDADKGYIIERLDNQIDIYSQRGFFYHNRGVSDGYGNYRNETPDMTPEEKEEAYNKMIEYAKNNNFLDILDTPTLVNLLESLKEEAVDIDFSRPIFAQLYRKNEDGTYSLTINPQSCQKSAQVIRGILEKFVELPILTPDKAHQLFGGFELKYDPDFREFLLANMDKIMENPSYVGLVASIQRQFSEIKATNSNRVLTWELAVSYVQTNKFTNVNVGNERAAEVSAIAGYSQSDFNTLQQIYNYGKQRTFSSIPRIEHSVEKSTGRYTYEILRLDDPYAMAIGTLTDCCQELNNCAEVCMEHSMVDKNGRVFVIRDEQGNIVAQSWVWRNKDVLCFDNIEIPDKAFARTVREHPELGRKGFTDEVFEIYKQAAHDLIEADEIIFRKLLESGKITQEQYDGLRLGKVTVGLGYNDIAESLKQNSSVDRGTISRPLPFEEPVELSRGLYTSDSSTQYILEEREDRIEYNDETLPVHSDTYIEYTDANFTEKSLLSLEKLEIVTKEDPRNLDTSVSEYADSKHLVTEIARNYGLNPKTTRIIMNPNFAIIYEENNNIIKIADLLYNTKIENDPQRMDIEEVTTLQIRLALNQIAKDKEIDFSELEGNQLEMYKKAISLTEEEIDKERGLGNGK